MQRREIAGATALVQHKAQLQSPNTGNPIYLHHANNNSIYLHCANLWAGTSSNLLAKQINNSKTDWENLSKF